MPKPATTRWKRPGLKLRLTSENKSSGEKIGGRRDTKATASCAPQLATWQEGQRQCKRKFQARYGHINSTVPIHRQMNSVTNQKQSTSKYRNNLPQLTEHLFLTDGGLETTLIFHEGVILPYFGAFHLLKDAAGTEILRRYFKRYANLASRHGLGVVLESPTWRANPDWAAKLGYDAAALAEANRKAIELLEEVRAASESSDQPIVISGNLGPRGDGYCPDAPMTARQSQEYHRPQVEVFARSSADMVAAFTMNYVDEAIGITLAARDATMPIAISFTLETDGRLPSGQTLSDAIQQTDRASSAYPAYYMINCAHSTHFESALREGGLWRNRIRGLRANASKRSHAELDSSTDLDIGNPVELGKEYRALRKLLPQLAILGGCCGTDHRHVEAICDACENDDSREIMPEPHPP
jgi:homocysteine S-methyltransferase